MNLLKVRKIYLESIGDGLLRGFESLIKSVDRFQELVDLVLSSSTDSIKVAPALLSTKMRHHHHPKVIRDGLKYAALAARVQLSEQSVGHVAWRQGLVLVQPHEEQTLSSKHLLTPGGQEQLWLH